MSELVRYIHLNPVRAKLVRRADEYQWSSHRASLGVEKCPWVDSEEVLRYFGARRKRAVETYRAFVEAGYAHGHREEFYEAIEGRLLGGEEFVGEVKHRIGEAPLRRARRRKEILGWEILVNRVEEALGVRLTQVQGRGRTSTQMKAKEMLIYLGRERGEVSQNELAKRLEIDQSNVARGYERARERMRTDEEFRNLVERLVAEA